MDRAAVLAPGYGGTARQPILRKLEKALADVGIDARAVAFSTSGRRPSRDYGTELADLRAARDALRAEGARLVALVGRSFGGRMCALLAADEPPDALAIIGHPIAPPGRQRPRDEAALAAVRCPTLVVQGDRDELGPIAVLARIAGENPRIDVVTLPGVGHQLGAHESTAAASVARWLDTVLR